jgi:hypothetical protein
VIRLINLADDIYLPLAEDDLGDREQFASIDFDFLDKYAEELRDFAKLASEIGHVDGWKHLRKLLTEERKDVEARKRAEARMAKKAAKLTSNG